MPPICLLPLFHAMWGGGGALSPERYITAAVVLPVTNAAKAPTILKLASYVHNPQRRDVPGSKH